MRGHNVISLYFFNVPLRKRIAFSSFSSLFKNERFILSETGLSYSLHAFSLGIMISPDF
jgi:hypothetical protein